jgi:hypothetical protein
MHQETFKRLSNFLRDMRHKYLRRRFIERVLRRVGVSRRKATAIATRFP